MQTIGNNRDARTKRVRRLSVLLAAGVVALCLGAGPAFGAGTTEVVETWSGADMAGWTLTTAGGVQASNAGQYVGMTFALQSAPSPTWGTLSRGLTNAVVWTNVGFRFWASNIPPSAVRIALHNPGSASAWSITVSGVVTGNWVEYRVPVAYAAGWSKGPIGTKALFAEDMMQRGVDSVEIYVRRNGNCNIQRYGLDDFRIAGSSQDADTDGDGIPDVWEALNGFDPANSGDAALDSDADGLSNYQEYLIGTDPNDPESALRFVGVQEDAASGEKVLRWVAGTNAAQSVEWQAVLGDSWSGAAGARSQEGATNVMRIPSSADLRGFYRVRVTSP